MRKRREKKVRENLERKRESENEVENKKEIKRLITGRRKRRGEKERWRMWKERE